jgi:hypothetical protein
MRFLQNGTTLLIPGKAVKGKLRKTEQGLKAMLSQGIRALDAARRNQKTAPR